MANSPRPIQYGLPGIERPTDTRPLPKVVPPVGRSTAPAASARSGWPNALSVSQIHRIAGEGPLPSPIMIVGHRPGKDEERLNRVFVGATGQELDEYLERAHIARANCYLTNLVKDFREGHPDPCKAEITRDEALFLAEIRQCQPSVIVALGAITSRYLLGDDLDIEAVHGIPHEVGADVLGLATNDYETVLVLPCYHPAAGLYNTDQMAHIQNDIDQIGRVLSGQSRPRVDTFPDPQYAELVDLDLAGMYQFVGDWLAIDTEGWRDNPWSLQASSRPGEGWVIRPGNRSLLTFQAIVQAKIAESVRVRRPTIILHNSMHDLEVLRHLGIDLPSGSFTDTMIMAYLLQLEPQGLKALAFRHAGMRMLDYDELTREASERLAREYLELANVLDWGPAEEFLILERKKKKDKITGCTIDLGMQPIIKKPWPLNKRIARILSDSAKDDPETGKVTNLRKRWHNIVEDNPQVQDKVESGIGPMPVATLDDVDYDRAIRYAGRDSDATLRIHPTLQHKIDDLGLGRVLGIDLAIVPMIERMQYVGMPAEPKRFEVLGVKCDRIMEEQRTAIKQLTGADINPDSGDQVAALLYDQLGIEATKFTKGRKQPGTELRLKRGSTNDKVLEALRYQHPVIPHITDYREASKIKSSFVNPLPRYLERDGRIHPTIRITRVVSGRISCTHPNLTAMPVRSEFGKEVRSCFVAQPGHILGSWDLDQIEMREMASQSKDAGLLDIFHDPKKDVHAETAAQIFGLHINERADNRKERYLDVDALRHRYPAKRVGFGVITGITEIGLKAQMDLAGATKNGLPLDKGGILWTKDECKELIDGYMKVRPGVERYLTACRWEAKRRGYVRDRWGRMRYLPGVFSNKYWVREEAERQSHSHKISASAQGVIKVAMARIWEWVLTMQADGHYIEPLIQIHDELVFELDDDPQFMKDWNDIMLAVLTDQKKAELDVPVQAKGGYAHDWGQLKD